MPLLEKDYADGMDYGIGVNDLNGDIGGQATTKPPPQMLGGGTGQELSFRLDMVQDIEDLHTQLGMSVDAGGSYGIFGGSEKFGFVQQSNFHSYSVFLYVHVNVINPYQQIEGEQLQPDAVQLLSAGQDDRFRQQFGDVYVKGIQTGGEYFALLQVKTTSASDQTKVSDELSAHAGIGGILGADVAAQFTSSVERVSQTNTISIVSYQVGGSGPSIVAETDVSSMITKAQNFGETVKENPTASRVVMQEYTALDLPTPPNFIDRQNAKDVMQQLAAQRMSLLQFLNDVAFIQSNPTQFNPTAPGVDLNALANQARTAFNQIDQAASACFNDVKLCKLVTVTMPDRSKLPARKSAPVASPQLIVHGAILGRWTATGGAGGMFGQPITTETPAPRGGFYNDFEHGYSIYWTEATGAHFVHGGIKAKWLSVGGPGGALGYPTTDETPDTGGFQQKFEHGTITWTPAGGAVVAP